MNPLTTTANVKLSELKRIVAAVHNGKMSQVQAVRELQAIGAGIMAKAQVDDLDEAGWWVKR